MASAGRWHLRLASVVCQKSVNAVVAEVDSSGHADAAGLCFRKISVAQTGAVLMASGSLCEWSGMRPGAGWMVEYQSDCRNTWTGTILEGPRCAGIRNALFRQGQELRIDPEFL